MSLKTEGTFVLDLRDRGARSLVWRAITRQEKNDAARVEAKPDGVKKVK